jgi:hypothetical protein
MGANGLRRVPAVVCEECIGLLNFFDRRVVEHAQAATKLKFSVDRDSIQQFRTLEREASEALQRAREAQRVVREHQRTHGC